MAVQPVWRLEERKHEGLQPDAFYRYHVARRAPVVIRGFAADWPATRLWRPEYFRQRSGDVEVKVEIQGKRDPWRFWPEKRDQNMPLRQFVELLSVEEPKHYLPNSNLLELVPELLADVPLGVLDRYRPAAKGYPEAVARRLRKAPLFWLGPAGALSPLHYDHADNLFVQIWGRKRFVLYPRDQAHVLYADRHEMCDSQPLCLSAFSPVEVDAPNLERYPAFQQATAAEVILEAGDALYMPAGLWHHVQSLDPNVSVSNWWTPHLINTLSTRFYVSAGICTARQAVRRYFNRPAQPTKQ